MKKLKLLIYLLLIFACSNDNETSENDSGSSGLIKSRIFKTDIAPNESDSKRSYFYSDGNKLKRIEYLKEKTVDDGTLDYKHHFFYENNLIVRIESFYRSKYTTNLNVVNYFEYDINENLVKFTRDSNRDGVEIHNYEYLNNGNVNDNYIKEGWNSQDTKTLEFDINRNLISVASIGHITTYEYDDKISPFFGIAGLDKLYFVEMNLLQSGIYPTYYNFFKFNNPDEYEYNSELKPVSNSSNRIIFEYY